MYARTTSLMADPAAVEAGVAFVRDEVWPLLRDMDGCIGLSMVVDRASGRSIVTSSWTDEHSLHESSARVLALRSRGVDVTRAQPPEVDEWEIACMHRAHETDGGAWVRAAWSRVPVAQTETAIAFYREALLPQIERLPGFVSASLMVDRAHGRGVTSVAFESREAMESTRDHADYLRHVSTQEASVETLDVAELELVVAHLRVPELV